MADLNVKGNTCKSFSSNSTVSMFVSMHITTNQPCVVKLIKMKIIPLQFCMILRMILLGSSCFVLLIYIVVTKKKLDECLICSLVCQIFFST